MAYDPYAESVRLIEDGLPESVVPRVSRRIRHLPLAVDVDGAIAATMFLRRGQGTVWREAWVLLRRDGSWQPAGGGGGTGAEADARDAPGSEELGGHLHVGGSGSVTVDPAGSGLPRVVRYAEVRAAHGVRTVLVAERAVRVPRHGWLIAVWGDRRSPRLTAVDEAGTVLAAADAATWSGADRSMPERYRD